MVGVPSIVHYWVDLQSVHGFRCYDNIVPNAECQRVLVLAVCLVFHNVVRKWRKNATRVPINVERKEYMHFSFF